MKKRIVAGILMLVMMFASVMGVSAAKSRTDEVYVSGASEKRYIVDDSEGVFADLKKEAQDVVSELSAGKTTSLSSNAQKALDGKKLICKIFDLTPVGDHTECLNRKYHEVELTVTTLTDKCSDVAILYYSVTDNEWKIIEPLKVEGNKITAKYPDLTRIGAPVAIYAKVAAGGAAGTSPSTVGTSSAWMIWTAAALIVLGSGVIVSYKKREQ